jgi:hypothetical protein
MPTGQASRTSAYRDSGIQYFFDSEDVLLSLIVVLLPGVGVASRSTDLVRLLVDGHQSVYPSGVDGTRRGRRVCVPRI